MGGNFRILLAFGLGLGMVGASFLWRPETADTDNTASLATTPAVRHFINIKDSDGNGMPDWQESFAMGTINLDATTSNATTTRTGLLASSLAYQLITGESTADNVLEKVGGELATEALDIQLTPADIKISDDNSAATLRSYGNQVAVIANSYTLEAGAQNELEILSQAFLRNDSKLLEQLEPRISAYEKMSADMLHLTVPSSLTHEHLSLINVYIALENDLKAFRHSYEDSLPAVLRYRRYPADAAALYTAISNLYLKLDESGIQWSDSDAASKFIEVQ